MNDDNEQHVKYILSILFHFLVEGDGTYETLRDDLDNFKANNNIDNDAITIDDFVAYIQKSNINFADINPRKFVDVFLMNFTDTQVIKNAFKQMAVGIDADNYINNIYSHDHCPRIPHDENVPDLVNLMNTMLHIKNMEMVVTLSTFVEMYYQTLEGKAFIEKFESLISSETITMMAFANTMRPDLVIELSETDLINTRDYFNELFEKMNTYSLRNMFIKNVSGDVYYKFEKNTTMNGMFISFQSEKIVLSAGLTTDSHNLAEGISPLDHGVISKLIAESIDDSLEEQFSGANSVSQKHDYWQSLDLASKTKFMTNALFNIFCKYEIIEDKEAAYNQFLSDPFVLENGMALATLKEVLLQLDATTLMNKRLGGIGVITADKLKQFFENTENFEFRMNYTTVVE